MIRQHGISGGVRTFHIGRCKYAAVDMQMQLLQQYKHPYHQLESPVVLRLMGVVKS